MPADVEVTKPVLIHVDPGDWAEFQKLCGKRRVSLKIRKIVREELKKAGVKRG